MDTQIDLSKIDTEQRNKKSMTIHKEDTFSVLKIINNEDNKVASAIKDKLPTIAKVIDRIFDRFSKGGRLVYIGAGTSGRLGVIDAAEMLPTYNVGNDRILGIIAGGDAALRIPVEGAEDDGGLAVKDLENIRLDSLDCVIGIGASGRTPYVLAGLAYCKSVGGLAIGLCMTKQSKMAEIADETIAIETGPEVVTGSTRMKAGTATKLVCNMISTTLMIKYGKVYQNLMVDLHPTNEKVKARVTNVVGELTSCSEEVVKKTLIACNYSCKHAIVMLLRNVDFETSRELLRRCDQRVIDVIDSRKLKNGRATI